MRFCQYARGTIYIGINDDKEIVGVPKAKRLMEDFAQDERTDNQHYTSINSNIFDKIVEDVSKICPRCVRDVSEMLIAIKNNPTAEADFNDLTGTTDKTYRRTYLLIEERIFVMLSLLP